MSLFDSVGNVFSYLNPWLNLVDKFADVKEKEAQIKIAKDEAQKIRDAQKAIADQNLQFQYDNLAYLKGVQNQVFQREDTAVSRRVADLQRAGLSPTLAAGSAASAGQAIKTDAPQSGMRYSSEMFPHSRISKTLARAMGKQMQYQDDMMVFDLLQRKESIAHTRAQRRMVEAMTKEKTMNIHTFGELGLPTNQQLPTYVKFGKIILNMLQQYGLDDEVVDYFNQSVKDKKKRKSGR